MQLGMKMAAEAKVVALIEGFVRSEDVNEQKKRIEDVARLLEQKETTGILNIVEALGIYLTNQDISLRRKGTQLLAELVHRLQPNLLNAQEIDVMTLFFCDRLQDHHSIQPQVIYGLLGMISYYCITDKLIMKICQTMFAEVHVQSLSQADRRNTFNLFSNLLDKYIKALQRMGQDFVLGFIQTMDGEKDPRNLLVCFKNVGKVVAQLSFEVFSEDLFEVTSCYFPIDFTPPSNDPFGVTKDDLVSGLRDCLSSTRKFAPFLLPLLIEKLSSDIVEAKIDSLFTFAASVLKYTPEDVNEFSEDIWNAIRRDFLLGGMKVLEDSCKLAIGNLIKCLEPNHESFTKFIHIVLRDGEHSLTDPDLAIAQQLGLVLQTVAFSSVDAFEIAMPRIMNVIFSLLNQQQVEMKLFQILQILHEILENALTSKQFNLANLGHSVFDKFSSFLLSTIASTQRGNLQSVSINCLLGMLQHGLLSQSEIKIVIDFVTDQICASSDEKVQEVCHKGIALICKECLEHVKGYISAKLKQQIQKALEIPPDKQAANHTRLKTLCKSLTVSFSCAQDLESIIKFLVEFSIGNKITDYLSLELLLSIEEIVTKNKDMAVDLERLIVPCFLDNIAKSCNDCNMLSAIVVQQTKIIQILVSNLPASLQGPIAKQAAYYYSNHCNMPQDSNSMETDLPGDVDYHKYMNLPVVNALLSGMHADVIIPEVQDLFTWLRVAVEACEEEQMAVYGFKTYASVINKMPEGGQLDSILEDTLKYIETMLDCPNVARKINNLTMLFIWVTKAIILRWHKSTSDMVSKLVSLCHNEVVGKLVCENFSVLVQDFPDCLNAEMHARMKLMYKQRFVEYILPILVVEYKKASDNGKGRFLKAISQLLQQLPKQVLQKKIAPLMPLLIRSLSFADVDILSSTLATIAALDAPDVLKEHVTSLIPRLLSLSGTQSLEVRMAAIKCLTSLCSLPPHSIYPYQNNVVRTLKLCLDDKKRCVRKETIKCRNQWYLLKGAA